MKEGDVIREALGDTSNAIVPSTMTETQFKGFAALDSLLAYIKQLEQQNPLGSAPGEGSPYASVESGHSAVLEAEAVWEAVAWLQRSRDSKSPSRAKVHASVILARWKSAERERDNANIQHLDLLRRAEAAEAQVKQLEGERDAKDRENVEAMTNSVRNLGAMRRWRERAEAAGRENERLREALETILSELGVPGDDYAAPVTNAVEIALAALAARTEVAERRYESWLESIKDYGP